MRGELHVVADADRREDESELGGHLAADERDALQQLAALALVDERDQPVADLELEHVERQGVPHRLGALQGGSRLRHLRRLVRACRIVGDAAADGGAEARDERADDQERHVRHAGNDAEAGDDRTCGEERPRTREQLPCEREAERLASRRARHDQAGRRRDQERRDLRGDAVADRQDAEGLQRVGERPALLQHPDHDAREEVDRDDDQARDGVAAHELRGAVHRAVEVGLVLDLHAALARLGVGDLAGVQVGVDRHLLAGHGVEGEARADLGDAPGAARDHDELDDHEDQEHDDADDQVAADDEVPERVDHRAGVAAGQDQPRDRDVDREPEQRREQQHRRERRELERLAGVHRHDDDQQRARDVHRHEQVEQLRRQRQQHHRDDHDDDDRRREIAVAQELAERPWLAGEVDAAHVQAYFRPRLVRHT